MEDPRELTLVCHGCGQLEVTVRETKGLRRAFCQAACREAFRARELEVPDLIAGKGNGGGDDDDVPNLVLGQVMTVGGFTMIRLLTLDKDATFQVAKAHIAGKGWNVRQPHAWTDYNTGPHITLTPAMSKYNGELVKVALGPLYSFVDGSRWVAYRAKLPPKFVCPHECHVSVAQQRIQ